jgi:RHS repeat-associated protein
MNFGADSFGYDGYGRRIAKTMSSTTTNYLFDGANVVQELSGTTPTANILGGLGIDEVFTRTDSTATANFLTDALGSTVALTDGSAGMLASYAYEPFGNTSVTSGSSANSYEYTGRENDGTGLDFYRARYYSPTLQRFVSEDPIEYAGNSPNLYAYVNADPMGSIDPFGLKVIYPPGIVPPSQAVQQILNRIDELNGDKDVIVIGGTRTPETNARVGGAANSGHLTGDAADIWVPGQTSAETAAQAAAAGAGGIGTYDNDKNPKAQHTHLDDRQCEWNGNDGRTLKTRPSWRPNPWKPDPSQNTSGRYGNGKEWKYTVCGR